MLDSVLISPENILKTNVNGMCYKIFHFMIFHMNEENVSYFGGNAKKRFLEEAEIKNQTFNNYVSKLIAADMIKRVGRQEFLINPKLARHGG